jgi:SAM-dependent methyltransferase
MTDPSPDVASLPAIDDVKAYWDGRPCNIRHSPLEVGTREYYDEVEARKYFVEPHIPAFAQFDRWSGKRVLEIGCGIGTDAVNFARAGAHYTGIELSPASMALAKRRFAVFGLTGEFHVGNGEHLSELVRPASFDLVYSFGVVHHTPDPRRMVAEARNAIAADGELRMMLYARDSWKAIMIEAGLDQPEAQRGCPIATTYTRSMIDELMKGLFALTSVEQTHIFPYVVEKYVRYEYEIEPWIAAMPDGMFAALERRLGWHYLIVGKPV